MYIGANMDILGANMDI